MTDDVSSLVLATNYAAHAIDALRDIERQMPWIWATSRSDLAVLRELIQKSEKFLLPPNGESLCTGEYRQDYFDLIRLPYPVVALETPATNSDIRDGSRVTKSLIIAWTKEAGCRWPSTEEADDAINFTELTFWGNEWRLRPGYCGFSPSSLEFRGGKDVGWKGSAAFPDYFSECSQDEVWSELGGMFGSGFNTLLEFCVKINCENVSEGCVNPSTVINQKRASKGKTPFFEYKFLQVPSSKSEGAPGGGTHSSPRMHLRRGHPRRLANGKVTWIRHTIVGNSEIGVVEKTYVVR